MCTGAYRLSPQFDAREPALSPASHANASHTKAGDRSVQVTIERLLCSRVVAPAARAELRPCLIKLVAWHLERPAALTVVAEKGLYGRREISKERQFLC